MSKIGVFDSGVGGQTFVHAIANAMPEAHIIYKTDKKNLPYGTKTKEQLHTLVLPILQSLVDDGCEIIVIACNTVTTILIEDLRKELPIPLIGVEPMVKVAAQKTKSKVIAICATPATLASDRYGWLKKTFASDVSVLEPDCSHWARMIEDNQINKQAITRSIEDVCTRKADVIVLGCTHYHWIEQLVIQAAKGRALVIQPELAVIKQLQLVLGRVL